MTRLLLSAVVIGLLAQTTFASGQAPNAVVTRESTALGTVDRIDRPSRIVTFRRDGNMLQHIYVDPAVAEFDDLKIGDVVTVRYVESVIVQVRPTAKPSAERDTTEEARKAGGDEVISQAKAVVTIERIDPQGMSVAYRTQDGLQAVRAVSDKALLAGLKPGDRVEVTATRERAVEIRRKKP
jgi:Cu/Ag efflux protein CusF